MKLPVGNYTFYSNLENCPHKAYRLYVAKDLPKEEPSPQLLRGRAFDVCVDKYMQEGRLPEPGTQEYEDLRVAQPVLDFARTQSHRIQPELAFTAAGAPCDYWADNAWFRNKPDLFIASELQVWLVDWKTGKVREEPFELETQALVIKCNWPGVNDIVGNYFWIQEGRQGLRYTLTNYAQTFAKLQAFRNEAEGYFAAGAWPKKRNALCGWCPVMDCEHNRKGK